MQSLQRSRGQVVWLVILWTLGLATCLVITGWVAWLAWAVGRVWLGW